MKRAAVAIVAILSLTAAIEIALGRTLTYRHGPLRLWSGEVKSDQNSQQLTDPYTLSHVVHGLLFYAATRAALGGVPLATRVVASAAIEAAWEVTENTDWVIERYRAETISLDYYGDSVVNSLCDVLACLFGFGLAARLPTRASIALGLALEVVLALWIRDNLTLNVIMLVHRVPAIAAWQSRP